MRAHMRRAASILLFVLVVLPLSDAVHLTRTRLELWGKLRSRHRIAPDAEWDRYYGQLKLYLPATGRVGLVQAAAPGTIGQAREFYFLQYALAPRLILSENASEEFVIACGPRAVMGTLVDLSKVVAVKQFEDDFTLYRRVAR